MRGNNSDSPLRVLCMGSMRTYANCYRRSLAFERIGCEVERIDVSKLGHFYYEITRRVLNRYFSRFLQYLWRRALVKQVDRFDPDVIFIEKGLCLTSEALAAARRLGRSSMKIAHYNPDDPFGEFRLGWQTLIEAIPAYDIHFIPKECNRLDYQSAGAHACYVYDRSFDATLHRPLALSTHDIEKYGCEVGFIGSWAKDREAIIYELTKRGIKLAIWGGGWQHGAYWEQLKPYWRGSNQFGDDYVKAICGMKIALHFLRHENRDEQDSRTFEIPACGAFMLAERSAAHERLFEDGREAVLFDEDIDDLTSKINYYLKNKKEREAIALAGYERCQASGYEHAARLQQFLKCIITKN